MGFKINKLLRKKMKSQNLIERIEKGKCLGYLTESISTDLKKEFNDKNYRRIPDLTIHQQEEYPYLYLKEPAFQ